METQVASSALCCNTVSWLCVGVGVELVHCAGMTVLPFLLETSSFAQSSSFKVTPSFKAVGSSAAAKDYFIMR